MKKGARKVFNDVKWRLLHSRDQKVFCIGMNKTGTTSLKAALAEFGYKVGNQPDAERLLPNYLQGNFEPIINYCKTANAFQDVPFSYTELFPYLDKAYLGSKFILTVRDNADEWYSSLTRFHAKIFNTTDRKPPSAKQLRDKLDYRGRNWFYKSIVEVFQTDDQNPYNEKVLKTYYHNHIKVIESYFENRPNYLIDFDIAIIGCGAYSFPLAANVKRIGKNSVHLGGASQLLFGFSWKKMVRWRLS
jgi:hypothetical protein